MTELFSELKGYWKYMWQTINAWKTNKAGMVKMLIFHFLPAYFIISLCVCVDRAVFKITWYLRKYKKYLGPYKRRKKR